MLDSLGLIEVHTGDGDTKVRLTDRFKQVLPEAKASPQDAGPSCSYDLVTFNTAEKKMLEVTGIVRESDTAAIVEFKWKWEPKNVVGEALMEGSDFQRQLPPEQLRILKSAGIVLDKEGYGRSRLILYDDGWRIDYEYDAKQWRSK